MHLKKIKFYFFFFLFSQTLNFLNASEFDFGKVEIKGKDYIFEVEIIIYIFEKVGF